jgi:tripartite-type tricarboxylate transporter receptor subunit TctC
MKNMKSQLFKVLVMLLTLSLVLAVSAASVFAAGDAYPSKPVRFIVAFTPGGSADIIGRLVATKLTDRLGKQVIVENHAGAGGVIGMEMVAKAEPDGYTLLFTNASYSTNPALQKLPFDPLKSLAPIAKVASAPFAFAVIESIPAKSVKDFIALAKQKPGQLLAMAAGVGGTSHLAAELLKSMAGIDFKIVQFKGAGPGVVDMLGGHSHFTIISLVPLLPHIQSGKFRALGTCGVKRSAILPNVPTVAEAGLPGYEVDGYFGILAPAGAPAPIIDRLNKELKVILTSDEVKKILLKEATEVDYMVPAEFGRFIERDINKWTRIVKEANIKAE